MKRIEYNLLRRLRADLKKFSGEGTTLTIAVNDMSVEFKTACHQMYMENGFHPANVRVDSHFFDDELRVIYVYGLTWEDAEGRAHSWTELYTDVERACFEAAISNEYHDMTAVEIWKSVTPAEENETTTDTKKEDDTMTTIKETLTRVDFDAARQHIEEERARSAWDRGLKVYALELLGELDENVTGGYIAPDALTDWRTLHAAMLNGAGSWEQYSWGGSALIYDWEIAERLCTPSELKKTRHGERRPNGQEDWLDVQARALRQASWCVGRAIKAATVEITTASTVEPSPVPAAQAV